MAMAYVTYLDIFQNKIVDGVNVRSIYLYVKRTDLIRTKPINLV